MNSFIENVNYVANLDNKYGSGIELYKNNLSLKSVQHDIELKFSYYNNDDKKIHSIVHSEPGVLVGGIDDMLLSFKTLVESSITGSEFTCTVSSGVQNFVINNIVIVNIAIDSNNNTYKAYELEMKVVTDCTVTYDVFGEVKDSLKILPSLAMITASDIDAIANVYEIQEEVITVSENIVNIETVSDSIANVNTVVISISNVNIVGEDIANVNTVASNIVGLNSIVSNVTEILLADDNAATATTKASEASTAATNAATSATASSNSAIASATSATSASSSATTATTSSNSATASATSAATSASTATTKAAAADVSATNAALSATSASTSSTSASNSATASATSAANAASSTISANASATSATASKNAASASESNAAASATLATTKSNEASASATSAFTSATNASASSSTATTQATNAATSATSASTSATNASNSATASTAKASEASTSASNAALSATNSANSATNSATSATASATSATNSATSATAAAASAASAASLASGNISLDSLNNVTAPTPANGDILSYVTATTDWRPLSILPVLKGGTGTTTSTGTGSTVLSTSPILVTPTIGVATGASFNSITGLSSTTPAMDGTATAGNGVTVARADHVHPNDTTKVDANANITAGTYKSVTVDVKGLVTSGTNPTTVAGYGITDAQSTLVSGTNIKTVNSSSILGSGNLALLASINPVITGSITEQVYNLTGTAINPANGTIQYKTVSANTTFTETLTSGQSVLLRLIGASNYTITFPTITWVRAVAPTLTANCAIVLWKEQSTLYGSFVGTLV